MEDEEILIEQQPKQKGLFGVKGTFRDILGTLGDAFLVQGGADRVYAPQLQREKQAKALFGLESDPMGAAQKLARAGFTEEARELYQTVTKNKLEMDKFNAENRPRQGKFDEEIQNNAASLFGALRNSKSPELQYPKIKKYYEDRLAKYGITPYHDPLPDVYNADAVDAIFTGAVPAKDQIVQGNLLDYRNKRLGQMDRGLDIREEGQENTDNYRGKRLEQIDRGLTNTDTYRGKRLDQIDRGLTIRENTPPKGSSTPKSASGLPAPRKAKDRAQVKGGIISSSDGKNWDYISTDGGKTWNKR